VSTVIDRIFKEHQELIGFLQEAGEISMVNNVDESFRKSLALAAASYFEVRVRDCIMAYVTEKAGGDEAVVSFLRNKAVERQYHTYFSWKDRKATQFFGLFGPRFKEFMVRRVAEDAAYNRAVEAFLELGELRNNLAHQDFAAFPVDKTVNEIYDLYKDALRFVDSLSDALRKYAA
jgi:hypothetical protein